jgi:hypothetical protein
LNAGEFPWHCQLFLERAVVLLGVMLVCLQPAANNWFSMYERSLNASKMLAGSKGFSNLDNDCGNPEKTSLFLKCWMIVESPPSTGL